MTLGHVQSGLIPGVVGMQIAAGGLHRGLVARLQKLERGAPSHVCGDLRA